MLFEHNLKPRFNGVEPGDEIVWLLLSYLSLSEVLTPFQATLTLIIRKCLLLWQIVRIRRRFLFFIRALSRIIMNSESYWNIPVLYGI